MKEIVLLLPEIFLILTILGIIVSEVGFYGEKFRVLPAIPFIGLAAALVQVFISYQFKDTQGFSNTLILDGFSLFFKVFFILLAGLTLISCFYSKEIASEQRAECAALVCGSTLAMCLAAAATDLLLIFLCLQLVNILSCFLIAISRNAMSTEAAIKSFVFSAVSGVILLFAIAIFFAHAGTFNIYEIHWYLVSHPFTRETGLVAFILLFLPLSAQVGCFPMNLIGPDVLQGAPTPISGFISAGVRAVGWAVGIRLLLVLFSQPSLSNWDWQVLGNVEWPNILAVLAGATMLMGGLLAQRQETAKRLVGCLVLSETGVILMGALVIDLTAMSALLFLLIVQLFAWVGAFFLLGFMMDQLKSDRLVDLRGYLGVAAPECIGLLLCLVCAIGLPPSPGFLAKFALIESAFDHQRYFLVVISIVSMALSSTAVARLAFNLVGNFATSGPAHPIIKEGSSIPRRIYLMGLLTPVILVGIFAEWVMNWAQSSIRIILW